MLDAKIKKLKGDLSSKIKQRDEKLDTSKKNPKQTKWAMAT